MKHCTRFIKNHLLGFFVLLGLFLSLPSQSIAQSVAREWNDVILEGIRNDFARPTVHARNLWHSSIIMYDAWAAYDQSADTYLLGKTVGSFNCPFDGVAIPEDVQAAQEEAMSYAVYRLILFRFQNSPLAGETFFYANELMGDLGYDPSITSTDYLDGTPAHLGNYLAEQILAFGAQDGSNEQQDFGNLVYEPVNEPLDMGETGNPLMTDPNRWQQLTVAGAIDQSGNEVPSTLDFLSPEWGNVVPFAMDEEDQTILQRDGINWRVYHDPGTPPLLEEGLGEGLESQWKWGHILVSIWQSHHDINDGVMIDISPASLGNNPALPEDFEDFDQFYNFYEGGDQSQGYDVNPSTGEAYEPQLVNRADYARVLAEFWADGPDSETPPGHWFTILNEVSDNPLLEKRWNGQGPILDDLQWDVKTYLTLGGGMHDCAISAWGIKGYYDYSRPVSAIRFMAEKGQCSDEGLPNYHPDGFPLIPGYVELVEEGDPLAGDANEFVGEVKLFTWRGPDYITNELFDQAGVGWILAKNWYPYQRPTFVTPPFAGYVSGHSVYSRCAAELMTLMTGDEYFPGGMSNFVAEQNEFLVFEEGPSTDIILQWATYRDASDQTSLSRIWGGIHPPADDVPGRKIGLQIAPEVFTLAESYFVVDGPRVDAVASSMDIVTDEDAGSTLIVTITYDQEMNTSIAPSLNYIFDDPTANSLTVINEEWISGTTYEMTYGILDMNEMFFQVYLQVTGAEDLEGTLQTSYIEDFVFALDTQNPTSSPAVDAMLINDAMAETGTYSVTITFTETMLQTETPTVTLGGTDIENSLTFNAGMSQWLNGEMYEAVFDLVDANATINDVSVTVEGAQDQAGNTQVSSTSDELFMIDTENPATVIAVSANLVDATANDVLEISLEFSEDMDQLSMPMLSFSGDDPLANSLTPIEGMGEWTSPTTFVAGFNAVDANETLLNIATDVTGAADMNGNAMVDSSTPAAFIIDTENPMVSTLEVESNLISDIDAGAYAIEVTFSEAMDTSTDITLDFTGEDVSGTLQPETSSAWIDDFTYQADFTVLDENIELGGINIVVSGANDANGNAQLEFEVIDELDIDTKNPAAIVINANDYELTFGDAGDENFSVLVIYDEDMNTGQEPFVLFPDENPLSSISENAGASGWINNSTYQKVYDVSDDTNLLLDVDVVVTGGIDEAGNLQEQIELVDYFDIDINPVGVEELESVLGNVYPNPVQSGDPINLVMNGQLSGIQVDVIGNNGQLVEQLQIPNNTTQFSIDTSELAGGIYLINVSTDQGNQTVRVQVLR
ncbi:MAG: T9SS type A sorting domain-containing protein [Flavobacteriales bacterium]|nr:T9SS type A sorting domain-containing protein [Flavobacteriales bacterium]MDG2246482.1 T9SS type A sorting domain-containing protein [Flavobacteriales bacterium]